jgi:hypothetical protein
MNLPKTKVEAKAELDAIAVQLLELETKCDGKAVDYRPWMNSDHPWAIEHWGLVQRRIALKKFLKKPVWSPERRKAVSARMAGTQKSHRKRDSGHTKTLEMPEGCSA